jgi:hypothetical protein
MTGLPRIFVDFNRSDDSRPYGDFFVVSLRDVAGLDVGQRAIATDHEIELPVVIAAILPAEHVAIVEVSVVGLTRPLIHPQTGNGETVDQPAGLHVTALQLQAA